MSPHFLLFCQNFLNAGLVYKKFKPQLEIKTRLKKQRFEIHVNSVRFQKKVFSEPEPHCELKLFGCPFG